MDTETIVRRIQAEFLEMPGLRLTLVQASRLWGLEHAMCESLIDVLVACAFLRRSLTGLIMRNEA